MEPSSPAPAHAQHPVNQALDAVHTALDFILNPLEASLFPVLEAEAIQLGATIVKRYVPDTNVQNLVISLLQTALPNAHLNAVKQLDEHAIGVTQLAKTMLPPQVAIIPKGEVNVPQPASAPAPKVVQLRVDAPS